MHDTYKTIKLKSEGLYKEKGSKFLSFAYPVLNEEEINDHLKFLKKQYHDARHHCYAYKLSPDGSILRMNDDNEPSYTAGKPILGQLESFELTNVLLVVVRYFGGTKLGKGGLISAYKAAAFDALKNNIIVEKTIDAYFTIECNYESLKHIMRILKEFDVLPLNQEFALNCKLTISLRKGIENKVVEKLKLIQESHIEYLYTA